jgi:hypothetical protein
MLAATSLNNKGIFLFDHYQSLPKTDDPTCNNARLGAEILLHSHSDSRCSIALCHQRYS